MSNPLIGQAEAVAPTVSAPRHHEVFNKFKCWEGIAPAGFWVNFLGVKTAAKFLWTGHPPPTKDRFFKAGYPPFEQRPLLFSPGEAPELEWIDAPFEYHEWIDLLEAVVHAEDHFTMIELGAGWGRWITNAAAALSQSNPLPYTLLAVEAEPTHFRWMKEHLANNGVDLACCELIEAAVTDQEGQVGFHTGTTPWGGPAECYGQFIGGPTPVRSITLRPILDSASRPIDLLDMDVQGAELIVLVAAADALDEKVRRVHTATHSPEIEVGLRRLFGGLGWHALHDIPLHTQAQTPWGPISFQDGTQAWINPRFFDLSTILEFRQRRNVADATGNFELREEVARLRAAVESLLETTSRQKEEVLSLRAQNQRLQETMESLLETTTRQKEELSSLRAQNQMLQDAWSSVEKSAGWRFLNAWRRVRNRLAPEESRRRKLYDAGLDLFRRQ
jgi:FkbM family methyltransferase